VDLAGYIAKGFDYFSNHVDTYNNDIRYDINYRSKYL